MHSNLARTATNVAYPEAVLVMQILTNPSVLDNLNQQGYRVDWEEVLSLFCKTPVISKPNSKTKTARKGGKEKQ